MSGQGKTQTVPEQEQRTRLSCVLKARVLTGPEYPVEATLSWERPMGAVLARKPLAELACRPLFQCCKGPILRSIASIAEIEHSWLVADKCCDVFD